MTGKTHLLAGGLAAGLALHQLQAPADAWTAGLLLGLIAGLLPDIDTEASMASRMIPGYHAVHSGALGRWLAVLSLVVIGPLLLLSRLPAFVQALPAPFPAAVAWGLLHVPRSVLLGLPILAVALLLLSWLLRHVIKHRGATHSLVALALVAVLAYRFADHWTATAVLAGYASHLVADFVTLEGVSFAWPVYRHPFGLAQIPGLKVLACRTGGPVERAFWQPLITLALAGTVLWHLWSLA